MECVQQYVRALLNMDRYGGRTFLRDEQTLVIYDTPAWSDREHHAMRNRFPECEISCVASMQSMSGFIVIIRKGQSSYFFLWASAFFLIMLGLVYVSGVLRSALKT